MNQQKVSNVHLGSTSWVTDTGGNAVQHLHYLPFGETFINQKTTTFAARYTFSGKEKDTETGYNYFGARYYNSNLSVWLSVDPMSDKYPTMSSYVYCADNPIKLVDPDGREPWIPPFLQQYINQLKKTCYQAVYDVRTRINANIYNVANYVYQSLPTTIHNTKEATAVYFLGGGKTMPLSLELGNALIETTTFQEKHQRIVTGKTTKMSGYFSVDMTHETDAFFVGRTRVNYEITVSPDKKNCTVTYSLFANDGYWDPIEIGESCNLGTAPDGKGPNREFSGGHPYAFKEQQRTFIFKNPGYEEQ